jgi:hypothetical protein
MICNYYIFIHLTCILPVFKVDEAKQRKRERERARYATRTQEQRNEYNKKRREQYHMKKTNTTLVDGMVGDTANKFKPTNVPYLSLYYLYLFCIITIL